MRLNVGTMSRVALAVSAWAGLAAPACAQDADSLFIHDNYTKYEYRVPMRDGVNLFTSVYVPKDASPTNTYPFVLERTCYSVAPYGADSYAKRIGPNVFMTHDKYIFVAQDVRGRYMSEGTFINMPPFVPDSVKARNPKAIDEASDTYDTIDWLLKNIPNNNGKVGQWGISYPGYYTSMGALSRHPALVVSSPQAPVTDFFFEDFHHNGALTQAYFYAYPIFGIPSGGPTTKNWWEPAMVKDGPVRQRLQLPAGTRPAQEHDRSVLQGQHSLGRHCPSPELRRLLAESGCAAGSPRDQARLDGCWRLVRCRRSLWPLCRL